MEESHLSKWIHYKIKSERKSAIRLIVLLSDQNLMKNFRKIGSSFLDRLCGIWSPIPLEVRSCALRQSISTPPWQQQCSPNDCTMGSKLVYCVKTMFVCFKGGMGTGACPGSPLWLTDVSVFAEIPKVVNSLCTNTVVCEPGQCVKTILLCQNYFIVSKLFYCVKPWRF